MTGDKGEPLKRVEPGDRLDGNLTASGWNAAMDAAQYVRDERVSRDTDANPFARQTGIVRVKNVSGGDVERGGVLEVTGPLFDPDDEDALPEFQRQVSVEGDLAAEDATLVVVAIDPIPEDGVGRAVISGACLARVRVTSSSHNFAGPDGAQTEYMASGAFGPARILAKQAGALPYTAWAYVLLGGGGSGGGTTIVKGKLAADLSGPSGSAAMNIWRYNGSAEAVTGDGITVHAWKLASGQTVVSGRMVEAWYDADAARWYLLGAECP